MIPNTIKVFLNDDFTPNKKKGNHLSVFQGAVYYKDTTAKPSSLKKVREVTQMAINGYTPEKEDYAAKIKNNIKALNKKIDKHNQSKLGKLILLASKIVGICSKRLASRIKNLYHIDEITIPDKYENIGVAKQKNPSQIIFEENFPTDKLHNPKTKGPDIYIPETSGTTVIKKDDNGEGTCIIYNEEEDKEPAIYPPQKANTPPPKSLKHKRRINPPKLASEDVNIPKWAANLTDYTGPIKIEKNAAFPYKFYIETIASGELQPVPPFQMMRWENLDALANSQDSIKIPSRVTQEFTIIPNVMCHAAKENGLIVNNKSNVAMYMRTSEGVCKIAPEGISMPIDEDGTYTFWLDNEEKTGFIITRRVSS